MTPPPDRATENRPPLRVAIVGLGTVGTGVIRLLETNAALIERRAGRAIHVVAVSARDPHKDRGLDLSRYRWASDPLNLTTADDVDAIVEVIGGADGVALSLAQATLLAGKAFVTANKAMIAHHGMALAARADEGDIPLKFEAAVAGGIPVIKALREGASANRMIRVYGILNGTCNYILTRMEAEACDFADALAQAQALGYAEADPGFDIDGIDASHKLAILASICFGTKLDFAGVTICGIRAISAADIHEADQLGYRIRLIGMAEQLGDGLLQFVAPCLVPADHPLGYVPGSLNAVVAEGNFVGRLFLEGAGAGDGPTASAVVADLIDVARDEYGPAFTMPVASLDAMPRADAGKCIGKSYVRMRVADRTGVLAEIATAMRDAGVSVESFIQRAQSEDSALIVLVTHDCEANAVDQALAKLAASPSLIDTPLRMPILAL
ncbi:MAG: homoserine dehydrogenase [Sphingopyxis sp.]